MQRTIYVRLDGDSSLVVAAPYDPLVVSAIKAIPGRQWDKGRRYWRLPFAPENIQALRAVASRIGWQLALSDGALDSIRSAERGLALAAATKAAGDAQVEHRWVTEPYAHQRAGLQFLIALGSGALLWEMGLGKSKTAIDYAEWLCAHQNASRVLVICPNSVKRNWAAEIEKHAGHRDFVIPSGPVKERLRQLDAARYVIVNCELLSIRPAAKALAAKEWDLVIVDESSRFKSPRAQRTKTLHQLRSRYRVILTGTPITGRPEDAWAQFHFVAPGLLGSNWWQFRDLYLDLDWYGRPTRLKPARRAEFISRITGRSHRILKREVIDLPAKVHEDRRVELTGVQQQAYRQMQEELRVELEQMPRVTASNVLTLLLRLAQITAGLVGSGDTYRWLDEDNAKAQELDELLRGELAGESVVIFGVYRRELEALAERYRDLWWHTDPLNDIRPIVYGPTPEPVRAQLVSEFQARRRRLLFVQSRTGGLGINLTAAQTAVYYTRSWSLEDYLQSQDRLHRIGQQGTVTIVHLIAEGTIDEEIATALKRKQSLADELTGDAARLLAAKLLGGPR